VVEDFDTCANFTHSAECGSVCRPVRDHAGLTMHGITERDHPSAFKAGLPVVDDFKAVFRSAYWTPLQGDRLPYPINLALADFAFHSGNKRAAKTLQMVLNELGSEVGVDGHIGDETLAAVAAAAEKHTARVIARGTCAWRTEFLLEASEKPNMAQFRKGWLARVAALEAKIG